MDSFFPSYLYESWRTFRELNLRGYSATNENFVNHVSWEVNSTELKICLRKKSSDFAVFNQVFIDQEYEPILLLVKEYNIEIKNIVDLGGNIGLTTLYLRSHFPSSDIHVLEPNKANLKILEKNIRENGFEKIHPYQLAIWSNDGSAFLINDFKDSREWSMRVTTEAIGEEIETVSLSTLMNRLNLDIIDILKIDIEGSEFELFSKDKSFLLDLSHRTKLIALELHGDQLQNFDIVRTLTSLKISCFISGETIFGINTLLCRLP